jgi:hypothetical protein
MVKHAPTQRVQDQELSGALFLCFQSHRRSPVAEPETVAARRSKEDAP